MKKRARDDDTQPNAKSIGKWEFRLHNAADYDFEIKQSVNDDTSVTFVLQFWPPMPSSQAMVAHVELMRGASTLVLGTQMMKAPKGQQRYIEYETHQLRMDTHNDTVECLYCAVTDEEKLRVHVPLNHPRAQELPWLAPDAPLPKDTRTIPQRSGPWFALRKQKLSGTKAYNYIGYYWEKKEPPTDYQKRIMRQGTECEPYAILSYLEHFPKRSFQEIGFACAPSPPYPAHWGASPDGLLHDPDMTWERVPDDYKRHLNMADWDVCAGCLEIKTSSTKTGLEPYFIVQAYMEMIALQVIWCDLIRYKPNAGAMVYRIYRHKPTEDWLVTLLKRADAHQNALGTIIDEPEFVRMRKFLQEDVVPMISKDAICVTPSKEILESYKRQREAALVPKPFAPSSSSSSEKKLVTTERQNSGVGGAALTILLEQLHKGSVQMLSCGDHRKLKTLLLQHISMCSDALIELERDE